MTKLWFKAKRYGWGWTPITWEGWLVILSFLLLIFAGTTFLVYVKKTHGDLGTARALFILWIAILTGALIRICYAKGERPRWRWGSKSENRNNP